MTVKGKDFKRAVAFIKDFLSKLPQDADCAELRDSLNYALLHMKKYFKTVWLQNQENPNNKDRLTSTSLHGEVVSSTLLQNSTDQFHWKWFNVNSPKVVSGSLPLDGKALPRLPFILQAAKEGDRGLIKQLIEKDPSCVKAVDEFGRSALLYAVNHCQNDCLETLLNGGARINEPSNDGVTAVHLAVINDNHEALRLLLRHGADPTLQDTLGRSALHWASALNDDECLQILFKCNITLNMKDKEGLTPAMWSCRHDCKHHFENLINRNDYTIEEADKIERDRRGRTWIHWSVNTTGSHDCLRSLLSPETVAIKDTSGRTALHLAAEMGSIEACRIILTNINPDIGILLMCDNQKRTCLELATLGGHGEVINCLLEQGADISHRDCMNKSALDYAVQKELHYCRMILQSYHDVYQHQMKKLGKTEREVNNNNIQKRPSQPTSQGTNNRMSPSSQSPLIFNSVPPPKPGLSPRTSNLTRLEDIDNVEEEALDATPLDATPLDCNQENIPKNSNNCTENTQECQKESLDLVQYVASDGELVQSAESGVIGSDMQPTNEEADPGSQPQQDNVVEEDGGNTLVRAASPESNGSNQSIDFGMDVSDIEDSSNGGWLEGKPTEPMPPALVVHPAPAHPAGELPAPQQVPQHAPSAPIPKPPESKMSREKIQQGLNRQDNSRNPQLNPPGNSHMTSHVIDESNSPMQQPPSLSPRRLIPLEDISSSGGAGKKEQGKAKKKKKKNADRRKAGGQGDERERAVSPVPPVKSPTSPLGGYQSMRPPSPAFPLSASRSPSPLSRSPTPSPRGHSERPATPPPVQQGGLLRSQQRGPSWEVSWGPKRPSTPSPPVTPREGSVGAQGEPPAGKMVPSSNISKAPQSGLTRGQTQPVKVSQGPKPPGLINVMKPPSPRGPSAPLQPRFPPPDKTSGRGQPFLPSPPGSKPNPH